MRTGRWVVTFVCVAVGSFAAGAWLTRRGDPAPDPGAVVAPLVVVDAGAVQLLPDASLRLDAERLRPPEPRPAGSSP